MGSRHKTDEVVHLVSSPKADQPKRFEVGWIVPISDIYRAVHGDHRVAHEVTLLAGHTFPRCNKCASRVHFLLIREASDGALDNDFRVVVYELPHPDVPGELVPGKVA